MPVVRWMLCFHFCFASVWLIPTWFSQSYQFTILQLHLFTLSFYLLSSNVINYYVSISPWWSIEFTVHLYNLLYTPYLLYIIYTYETAITFDLIVRNNENSIIKLPTLWWNGILTSHRSLWFHLGKFLQPMRISH